MARYPLVGGPCDGTQSINFTVQPPVGYQVLCQSHLYTFRADGTFRDAGVDPVLAGDGPTVIAARGHRGWSDLQGAVNRSVPSSLARSKALTRAATRRLARRRRLG